jgi:putative DNA primase/helicase
MRGKRLVVTNEIPHHGWLNVELLKDLTGGEEIGTSRKYERLMKFLPTWVFFMFGNKKPGVGVARDPFWERMLLLNFPVNLLKVIPSNELLPTDQACAKLLEEQDGILLWCLEGWQRYRKHRFVIPEEVRKATKLYQHDIDQMGQFMEECLVSVPGAELPCKELWKAYKAWFEELGAERRDMIGRTKFYAEIEARGFPKHKCERLANLDVFDNVGIRDESLRSHEQVDEEDIF